MFRILCRHEARKESAVRTWLFVFVAVALLLVAGLAWWNLRPASVDVTGVMPPGLDIAKGEALYAENCAACHGTNLEGQPDWQTPAADGRLAAPPHDETGHTWHHPDRALFQYTKLGGRAALALQDMEFDSGMPAFGDSLTDAEIWSILAFIQSTWPDRARAVQRERTAGDLANGGN